MVLPPCLAIHLAFDRSTVQHVLSHPSSSPTPVLAHCSLSRRCYRRKTLVSQVATRQLRLVSVNCSQEAVIGEGCSFARNPSHQILITPSPSLLVSVGRHRLLLLKVNAYACEGTRSMTSTGAARVFRSPVTAGHLRCMMSFGSVLGWSVWRKQGTAARAAYMASLPLVC
jgi:hypothetical protein